MSTQGSSKFSLFGFTFSRVKDEEEQKSQQSFSAPNNDDGAITITSNAHMGVYVDMDGTAKNEMELISRYREMAMQPEIESALDDIVNEAISINDDGRITDIVLDDLKQPDKIKKAIREEFATVLKLLNYKNTAQDIFRRYYVDGKMYYHIIIDKDNPTEGIKALRYIDPRKLRKVREIKKKKDDRTGVDVMNVVNEYYIFNDKVAGGGTPNFGPAGVRITTDSIISVVSGLMDSRRSIVLSYLHKCIKPLNQLRMIEDATVIYRISRAPERRIFYIDVGNLPKLKAEQYLRDIMAKYKNKLVYDAATGEVRDDRKFMSMMEDFWLPRREGGKGTEITTLPGGCFDMNTSVSLLDGRELSIRDIEIEMAQGKELWTYSCEPFTGKIVPGLISWAGVTHKSAKVMKLTLDNGEDIICTPDHKFPQYDQEFKRAGEFEVGDSLIPLYRRKHIMKGNSDYEQIFDNSDNTWKYTHRVVADTLKDTKVKYKVHNESISDGSYGVRHHVDFNRFNNDPNNLVFMSWEDHTKYHQDNIYMMHEHNKNIKENNPVEYENMCKKIGVGIHNYVEKLSEEDRELRAENSRAAFKLGNVMFNELMNTDEEFRKDVLDKRSLYWTDETRQLASEHTINQNVVKWQDGGTLRANHKLKQKMEFSHDMLRFIIDLVHGKTTHEVTLNDVIVTLNNSSEMLAQLYNLNKAKSVPNWNINIGFTATIVPKLVNQFGYDSWKDFRIKESLHNHRITAITYLDDEIEVGTLTIDSKEIYHDYHSFALTAGVMTKNSNLGELEDVKYFEKKLYKALNVPVTRLEPSQGFSLGRITEVTRDELKFAKFIDRMRNKFSDIFNQALRAQCILKGICTIEEWDQFKENIHYDFIMDNNFAEMKDAELMKERLSLLQQVDPYTGRYYSQAWIQRNVLCLNDIDIETMQKEMDKEKELGFNVPVEVSNQVMQAQMMSQVDPMQQPPDQAPADKKSVKKESHTFDRIKRVL